MLCAWGTMVALNLVVQADILSTARRHPKPTRRAIASKVGVTHKAVARWLHGFNGSSPQVAVPKRRKECTAIFESYPVWHHQNMLCDECWLSGTSIW